MNEVVQSMLEKYSIKDATDAENALKEVIQEIALLGLHRSNFFEKAAFYGGTALRILYGLPRYSEDLDFTLFKTEKDFSLKPYFSAVEKELAAYGFNVEIESVEKNIQSKIESAFIKTQTKIHLLKIENLKAYGEKSQPKSKLHIKFEVDTDPCTQFEYETRYLMDPTTFPVISLKQPDLFAGKIHDLLFRKWKHRIKGRDFYDFVWYLKKGTPVRLHYLKEKVTQSGHGTEQRFQSVEDLKSELFKRFETVDFENAKKDILPFIRDEKELEFWNVNFFKQITEKIQIV